MIIDPFVIKDLGSTGLLIYLVVKEALYYGTRKKTAERNGYTVGSMSQASWELKIREIDNDEMQRWLAPLLLRIERIILLNERILEKLIEGRWKDH